MVQIKENILLAPFTIYKIGGHARFFAEVANAEELKEALQYAMQKNIQFVILGAASNVLISDKGFDGLIIRMLGGVVTVNGERMYVDAGVMMARAVIESGRAGLHGFEWGIGVPGTIGGSIRGNAGCFGGEMKDVVESVEVFDALQTTNYKLQAADCGFGYRDSLFKIHHELVIVSAVLHLQTGDRETVQQNIQHIMKERIAKQDIGSKCCGCIFKNTEWPSDLNKQDALCERFPELITFRDQPTIPSAFLIDHAGMKGTNIGNVCISDKHANFFINKGGGTSNDVMELISLVKGKVKEKYGIELSEEIYYVK